MSESNSIKPEILVIDDDDSICETLEVIIQSLGYYCVYFTNPHQGLEYYSRERNPIILLDVNFPTISGLEILAKIKSKNPMSQVLMMTGEREIQTVVSSLSNRATDFLLKPFNLDSVKSAIERAYHFYSILKDKESNDESILRDLRLASKLQSKVFNIPQDIPFRVLGDIHPALFVSGDYYHVLPLDENNVLVLLGDIEDHGVTSGLIALLMSNLVRDLAKNKEMNPSMYLEKMNKELCYDIGTHSMTAVVMIINTKYKKINYSRGGHPFPVFYPNDRSDYQLLGERSGHLLGIMSDIDFINHEMSFQEGDVMLIYSDGLLNSLQSPLLSQLNLVHKNSKSKLDEMDDSIRSFIGSQKGSTMFQDDISYLLLEL
ncbi:MAG: SpoIIE family protein phosphatase [Leptospira sp.]|nr:SpoIIE family protein phosphatase [Leptospira sp.]NCS94228.1 SpoIIE family protein phosphatase [Leptospira sp.]